MKHLYLLLILVCTDIYAQPYFTTSKNGFVLSNGQITREINFPQDSIYSSKLFLNIDARNIIAKSAEFSFLIDDELFNGFSGWKIKGQKDLKDATGGKGLQILLSHKTIPIDVELSYLLYPNLPIIRKWISITNRGSEDLKLEEVNIEDLETQLSQVSSVVYHNYGRMKQIGQFVGNWDDPVVVVHNISDRRGIALGNEAASILKRTSYHTTNNNNVEIGLTHREQDFPFRKWLKLNETWVSPKVFISLYTGRDNGFDVIENEVNAFVIKHMNPRIVQLKEKPTFVYNTWYPFRTFINDSLIREAALAASQSGIQEFILDDGWQINHGGITSDRGWGNNYGDWEVDTMKFPGGLKPTFDYIDSLGMKPGLWISIGAATKDAKVFKEHPEWFIQDKNFQLEDIHQAKEQSDFFSSCYGTEWFTYIKNVILRLANDHGLAYAKLDFAVVTSAYVNDNEKSGCYATDHPYHKDHEESFGVIYQRVLTLFDELHKETPGLFIDCTFETAGKLQLMDYAIAQHAEGNWLSNFEEPSPVGPLRVRQMAWWRSPAVPASSLVIGNQAMDDPGFEFSLKSLIGTLPIVLGDPRKLSVEKRKMIKNWSDWMKEMQGKYDYMTYRKDLSGFGEPTDGAWDGWQRLNFQTKTGGIFGVFRQGAKEQSRTVVLNDLDPDGKYIIKEAPGGKTIFQGFGEMLMNDGLTIEIQGEYDGRIFEVGLE